VSAPANRRALAAVHRRAQLATRERVAGQLSTMLHRLPSVDQPELELYTRAAYPVVAGGQRRAADLGAAYLLQLKPPGVPPARPVNVTRALDRSGTLVSADSRSLVAPVLRARRDLAAGVAYLDAIGAAASYAGALSSNDLAAAERVGLDEGADAGGVEIHGWRKGLSGDACDWCQSIAEQVYGDADSIPFHDHDRCGPEPVLEGDADEPYVYDDSDIPF
jgi:hypothetical protein